MRVAHIAIAVPDLDAARQTWATLLELPVPPSEALPNQGVTSCCFHLDNLTIELVTPLGEDSPIAGYLAKRGAGIHHVALATDDLAATLAAKQAQGFQIIPPRAGPGAEGMQVTFLHPKSVAGILVEFVQPAPEGSAATAAQHLLAGGYPINPLEPPHPAEAS